MKTISLLRRLLRTLRIWLRRQTGKYWPSVCYTLESEVFSVKRSSTTDLPIILGSPTAIFYHESSRRLFCGCDTGLLHVRTFDDLGQDWTSFFPLRSGIPRGWRFQQDDSAMYLFRPSESHSCLVFLSTKWTSPQCLSRKETELVFDRSCWWQSSASTKHLSLTVMGYVSRCRRTLSAMFRRWFHWSYLLSQNQHW